MYHSLKTAAPFRFLRYEYMYYDASRCITSAALASIQMLLCLELHCFPSEVPQQTHILEREKGKGGGGGGVRWLVWFGLVWFGLVWFGLVWFGLVWFGLVWFGFGLVWFVWFGCWVGLGWVGWVGLAWVGCMVVWEEEEEWASPGWGAK